MKALNKRKQQLQQLFLIIKHAYFYPTFHSCPLLSSLFKSFSVFINIQMFFFQLIIICLFFLLIIFLFLICCRFYLHLSNTFTFKPNANSLRTMIVIGAGGHCKEMLTIINYLDFNSRFNPTCFLIANDDSLSLSKLLSSSLYKKSYKIFFIQRSRQVNQSYFSSIFTTLLAFIDSLIICLQFNPQLLLCNGPGTCIPPIIAAWLITSCQIVYIESFCRVSTLSLSAKIAKYFTNHVLVQWPMLAIKYPQCKYVGLLV